MKLTNEICISFLRGSGWLYNHDKEITISERNKAIDDFAYLMRNRIEIGCMFTVAEIDRWKEQLKAGANNGTDNQ